ncbi:Ger(x)C family spore germination protein [Bacillus marinisedimentorum]|uniref:Ger(x)C family spore germination protein n=1 Tax=Bacillus marinisedimentorum TaxID=1821260 RepID=UPI000B19B754|nr:Ger(x)C family spore germination protein [Bacillus marinisedimentorum]
MKSIKCTAVFIMIAFLSGCWGSTELPEISIVSSVGIDRSEDGEIQLTTHLIDPTAVKNEQEQPYNVQTISGKTVFKAVRESITVIGEKQNWQHVMAFIVGKDIAEESVIPILDFFSRDHEPRLKMYMMVADRQAREILEDYPPSTEIPAVQLQDAIDSQEELSEAPKVEYHDFIQYLRNPYIDPYMPVVRFGEEGRVQVHGTAVFKDDRVAGYLGKQETVAFQRVKGDVKGGLQLVELEERGSAEQDNALEASIEIKQSKSSTRAKIKNGEPVITIEVTEIGFIGELTEPVKVTAKLLKEIENEYEKTVKQEIEESVKKIQKEFQANLLGFAEVIEREDPAYWKKHKHEWSEIYPELEVQVNVKATIRDHGLIEHHLNEKGRAE